MKSVKFGIIVLLLLFVVEFQHPILAESFSHQQLFSTLDEEKKIFELVNKEREKKGIDLLEWNLKLAELARSYSQKMAREKFFDHFDNKGNSVGDRAKLLRITKWRRIGENLFMCDEYDKFPLLAIKGWMKSATHRNNILEENYNQTGIGVAHSFEGKIYVTQVFLQDY